MYVCNYIEYTVHMDICVMRIHTVYAYILNFILIALPNYYTQHGWTPLYNAANRGHSQVVQLLLSKGADVDSTDHVSVNNIILIIYEY